jgi:PAS domain S-box-containing protein
MPPRSDKKSPRRPAIRERPSRRRRSDKIQPRDDLFDKAFRLSPHPIGITELETGRCLEVNDTCLNIFGFQRDEVIGKTTLMLGIWPDPHERAKLIERLQSEGSIRNAEVSMRMKNQDLRHFLISTELITLDGKRCLLTIGNDITERIQAEGALRELNELLEHRVAERTAALCTVQARQQVLLQAAPVVLYARRTAGDFGTTFISENVVRQLGYSPRDFVEHSDFWVTRLHPDDRPWVLADLTQASEHGHHVHEYRFRHKDGAYRWLYDELRLLRDSAGVPVELIGFQIDVTRRKQVEEELRRHQTKLEELTSKLLMAQELERQRIARDLHDDVTQRLASLAVDAGSLERLCRSEPVLLPHCRHVREAAERLADDVHSFAYRLHPSSLEHLGLEAAIRDHAHEFAQRTALAVRCVSHNVPKAIPLEMATCLYRVMQESLQNVLKHADASTVVVRLIGTSNGVGVCIHDDGKGFEENEASSRGLGLLSMEERVRLAEGTFRIRTHLGNGTEVHAWIPLPDARTAGSSMTHRPRGNTVC